MGDYNLPHLSWVLDDEVNGLIPLNAASEQELALTENLISTGLQQICTLTNVNGRILDLAFVNNAESVELIEPPSAILQTDRHHKPFVLRVDLRDSPDEPMFPASSVLNFRRCNYVSLFEALESIDWDDLLQNRDSNTATAIFYNNLYSIIHRFVPFKRVHQSRTYKPWWNADLRHRRNVLRKARKRFFRSSTPENKTTLERLEKE